MKIIINLLLSYFLLISSNSKAQSGESPISLELPGAATIGVAVPYSGESIMYKEFKTVKIIVTGPKNYTIELKENLSKDGKFNSYWVAPQEVGIYTFLATSSDGKAKDTMTIKIEGIDFLDNVGEASLQLMAKMETVIDGKAKSIQSKITAADKKVLDEKMAKFKSNVQQYKKCMNSIQDACKKIKALTKPGQDLPRNTKQHLTDLKLAIAKQDEELKRVNEYYKHTPNNYNICDYLNAFKEALAAYSAVANFAQKSIKTVLQNIAIDKALPLAMNTAFDKEQKRTGATYGSANKATSIEVTKLFATATSDISNFISGTNIMGLVGDVLSFIVDVLIKNYCFSFNNKITQENKFTYVNEYNEKWYVYKSKLEGVLSLRAPKADASSNIIKMKGSIEGNLTNFKAFADPKACIAKELKATGNYQKTICFPLVEINPVTVPFSTAANDVAGFGFGARMVATPACFNVQVDAEYNQQTKEIKLFVNKANAVDFSPAVKFRQLFMYIALLPMTQYQDYPIEKAALTFFANFREKNIFPIIEKGKGDKTFSGNVKRTVKSDGFNIDLSVTIDPE